MQLPEIDGRASRQVPVLEIGGTHVTAALVDLEAEQVVRLLRRPIDAQADAEPLVQAFAEAGRQIGAGREARWGVAIPGPFDYARGVGAFEGVGKFESLAGHDVRADLAARLGLPPDRLHFLNDATAYGLGEWAHGAGGRQGRVVCLTLGTGVGSVFLKGGSPVEDGGRVPPDGHVHHLTHAGAPLEETMSRRALRRAFEDATGVDLDVHEIVSHVRSGDPVAQRVWSTALTALGTTVGPWVARFEAQVVVVGGSIAESFDLVEPPLREGLRQAGVPDDVDLVRARHLEEAPLLGAAEWAGRR